MKKKPDKFDRIVQDWVQDAAGFCKIVDPSDAARMLRQYHNEVVEMVRMNKVSRVFPVDGFYNAACDDILAKLKEFTK